MGNTITLKHGGTVPTTNDLIPFELGYCTADGALYINNGSQIKSIFQSNGAISTVLSNNLTASRVLISDTNGKIAVSAVTSTELEYLDGVTSAVQTQLNKKQSTVVGGASTIVSNNLTASRALVSNTDGKVGVSEITATELNYLDGVSSNIQTQLNGKSAMSHNHSGLNIEPTAIELKPGSIADHGGYIDFHYQNDSGDYTSRIVETSKGLVMLNGFKILTAKNITAVYGISLTFASGKAEYTNSAITASTICIAQIRSGTPANVILLGTSSSAGKVTITASDASFNQARNVSIIMINP